MNIHTIIENLEHAKIYQEWKLNNPQTFLAHAFTTIDGETQHWQLGYSSDGKTITTFLIQEPLQILPNQEVLKPPTPLLADQVKIEPEQALHNAQEKLTDKPIKIFFLLSTIEKRPVYHVTFILQNLFAVVVKIFADDGTLLSQEKTQLFMKE